MRVVQNDAVIQRNRRIAQMSFFFSLIALLVSFIFGSTIIGDDETAALYFNCGILPTLFLIILFAVRMANSWIREPVPWESLQEAVRGLNPNAVLYHFVFPARHVLIGPMGVFVLYPMFQDRQVYVNDDRWRMPGGFLGSLLIFMRQEAIGNPTRDARAEAQLFQRIVDQRFPEIGVEVQPLIVFTSPRAKVELEGQQSVPVVFATNVGSPTLKEYLKSIKDEERVTLSKEQIEALENETIYQAG
ncbi:MAG: hypothetical protein GYB66_15310 [Chloroflexi bacterium]|jgi:hypothetical protein|nr:hypothetical protein [Chloroflexota bacterium]